MFKYILKEIYKHYIIMIKKKKFMKKKKQKCIFKWFDDVIFGVFWQKRS